MTENNETAAMLVSQTNPVAVEVFSYVHVNTFLLRRIGMAARRASKNPLKVSPQKKYLIRRLLTLHLTSQNVVNLVARMVWYGMVYFI